MKVEGLVVPPHRFRRYRWVIPLGVEHPSRWHYGVPREHPHTGSLSVDLSTVDRPLQPIVSQLHAMKISTLPSCAGHFGRQPERVMQAARDMAAQEGLIRGRGLRAVDVESGDEIDLHSQSWRSPSASDLMRGFHSWAGVGYLGAVLPLDLVPDQPSTMRWGRIQPVKGASPPRVDLWAFAPGPRAQAEAWSRLGDSFISMVESRCRSTSKR